MNKDYLLLGIVTLMSVGANLPHQFAGLSGVDRKLLLIGLLVVVSIALIRYSKFTLVLAVAILAIGANLPQEIASAKGIGVSVSIVASGREGWMPRVETRVDDTDDGSLSPGGAESAGTGAVPHPFGADPHRPGIGVQPCQSIRNHPQDARHPTDSPGLLMAQLECHCIGTRSVAKDDLDLARQDCLERVDPPILNTFEVLQVRSTLRAPEAQFAVLLELQAGGREAGDIAHIPRQRGLLQNDDQQVAG